MEKGRIVLNGTPQEVFSHVEEFHRMKLRLPQVTEFAYQLEKDWNSQFQWQISDYFE